MNKYYEKYWVKNVAGGVLNLPPTWNTVNLLWHFDFFKKYIGEDILDIGAGDGTFLNYLMSRSTDVKSSFACEISEEAIKIGKAKYKNITFKQSNIENLGFESGTFDTVFAIEILEHILDTDTALGEVNRILKSDGFFCVTTTDFNWIKEVIIAAFFWNKFFYPNNPHIRFFTKKTLVDLCAKHGMELVEYRWNKSYFGLMPKGQMIVFKKKNNQMTAV